MNGTHTEFLANHAWVVLKLSAMANLMNVVQSSWDIDHSALCRFESRKAACYFGLIGILNQMFEQELVYREAKALGSRRGGMPLHA